MEVVPAGDVVAIHLDPQEARLLRLALKRATFEDTPADSLTEVIDFAVALMSALGEP